MMLVASYLLIAVREFLSNASREQMIGRGGPMEWPAHSANINPSDFYIWGHPNSIVRAAEEGNNVQQLQQRVQHGF
jgi:hypothetical protein